MDYSQVYDKVEQSVLQIVQLDGKSEMISGASGCIVGNGHFVLTCSHCCDPHFNSGILYDDNHVKLIGVGRNEYANI